MPGPARPPGSTVRARNSRSWLTTDGAAAAQAGRRPLEALSPSRSRSLVGSSSSSTSYRESSSAARPARAAWPPESVGHRRAERARTEVGRHSAARSTIGAAEREPAAPARRRRRRRRRGAGGPARAPRRPSPAPRGRPRYAGPGADARVSPGRRSGSCGRCPTVAVVGLTPTLPASATCPASIRSSVDLPAPLAPTRPTTSPGATTRSRPAKRARSPWPAERPVALTVGTHLVTTPYPG